jgi:hypothetical protein
MLWNSVMCLDCFSFKSQSPDSWTFDFIKILAQIILFFPQKFNKTKNNLIYVEMVKVLWLARPWDF